VDAMRKALNGLAIDGTVVIGEGERDEAPMLFIGERVGAGGPKVDIALDPLEGTTICAMGGANALAVVAMAEEGGLLQAPDVYMEKIAVGPGAPANVVDLDETTIKNLQNLARAKGRDVSDIVACVLNRPRHEKIISDARQAGARIQLIQDGDVAGVIATAREDTGIDIYMGIGGAPEGVLAAAALRCLNGEIFGRLIIDTPEKEKRAHSMGITDFKKVYSSVDLAAGKQIFFVATGVTDGTFMKGVRFLNDGYRTSSLVMQTAPHRIQFIETIHVRDNASLETGFHF